jgi:hypothetical protein
VLSFVDDASGHPLFVSVEHAYQDTNGDWLPKIPPGRYRCVRGAHSLDGVHKFDTFEITGVEGHTGLLFHPGNTELDSKGCVCLGTTFGELQVGGQLLDAVLGSRDAFGIFMTLQMPVDEFWLTVQ